MTIFEWILLIVGVITVAPTLAFLCAKWGLVGFYRGKEAFRKQNETNVQDNSKESEN